jgi:hypothetical protein
MRMRRWILVTLAAALVAGCSSISFKNPFAGKKGPEPEELPAAEWARLQRENAQRIRGEGIPREVAASGPAATQPTGQFEEFMGFLKFTFYTAPKQIIDFYLGNTPGKYARMMEDDQSADSRRTGILRLVTDYDFARKEPYTKRYWQIAQGDPDYLVRVAAVRALDRSRNSTVAPIALKYLDDPNPLLRLEAAKALANIPDEKAVPALLRHLSGVFEVRGETGRMEAVQETRDVRVACADALRNFHTREVAAALVAVLKEKDFEAPWQARKSLILMTGHDFHYDQGKWTDYLTKAANPFG